MITWMTLIVCLAGLTAWVLGMQAVCRPEPHDEPEPIEVTPPWGGPDWARTAAVTPMFDPHHGDTAPAPSDTLSRWQDARRAER